MLQKSNCPDFLNVYNIQFYVCEGEVWGIKSDRKKRYL